MSETHRKNYCDTHDNNDAYKYTNDMNQLRDSAIGYGKENKTYLLIIILV